MNLLNLEAPWTNNMREIVLVKFFLSNIFFKINPSKFKIKNKI